VRKSRPPFRFDVRALIKRATQKLNAHVDGVAISLPFITVNVKSDDLQKQVAQEILIRLADRRVLNAWECCDNCIGHALASLEKIRSMLVEKQVEMRKVTDSPLYFLVEFMLEGIRQFLTFTESMDDKGEAPSLVLPDSSELSGRVHFPQYYFAALETLRAHLHRCLIQVAKIADTDIPKIPENMRYEEAWPLEAYERPGPPVSVGT